MKPTLSSIDTKLDDLKELVLKHIEQDERTFEKVWNRLDGTEASPGLYTRLDRLEQLEAFRRWSIRAVWVALLGVIGAMFKP